MSKYTPDNIRNQHTVKTAPWRDRQILQELYVTQGLSSREVADELDCGKKTVLRWLRKHEIDIETPTWERPPTFHTLPMGYEQIKAQHNNKQYAVQHHRLLAVAEFGLSAVKDKIVHHKNGIPWDNRHDNLELMDQGDHARLHSKTRKYSNQYDKVY